MPEKAVDRAFVIALVFDVFFIILPHRADVNKKIRALPRKIDVFCGTEGVPFTQSAQFRTNR